MEESWTSRMRTSTMKSIITRRKSAEETSTPTETLDLNDLSNVFGGPPRRVLCRQFSGDFTWSTMFYEDIFRLTENVSPAWSGRILPEFIIPTRRDGDQNMERFYDNIFRSDEDHRRSWSRSKSKTNSNSKSKSTSSSVLSSEDLGPLRPAIADDAAFTQLASKLRPINVASRWNSSTVMHEEHPRQQGMPAFSCNQPSYAENQFVENEYINFRSSHFGFSKRFSSAETISLEPNSYESFNTQDEVLQEQEVVEQEEDEVMSSYVAEINSDYREGTDEALAVDETIAWIKDKCQRQHGKEESVEAKERPNAYGLLDGHGSMRFLLENEPIEPKKLATEEDKQELHKDTEMELLDEKIKLWSAGKEANIRLLLSTLHHVTALTLILWPESGWYEISLTNLIESSHVKKAYQKAKLCLHPNKLQQRGAKLQQEYVAKKAFLILQDAWAAFISQDIFFL